MTIVATEITNYGIIQAADSRCCDYTTDPITQSSIDKLINLELPALVITAAGDADIHWIINDLDDESYKPSTFFEWVPYFAAGLESASLSVQSFATVVADALSANDCMEYGMSGDASVIHVAGYTDDEPVVSIISNRDGWDQV